MNQNKSKPFVEVNKGVCIELREPTEAELAASTNLASKLALLRYQHAELLQQIKDLEATCQHTVCVDHYGFPYDSRVCAACGVSRGLI